MGSRPNLKARLGINGFLYQNVHQLFKITCARGVGSQGFFDNIQNNAYYGPRCLPKTDSGPGLTSLSLLSGHQVGVFRGPQISPSVEELQFQGNTLK